MSEAKDAGPAFPHVNPNYDGNWNNEPQRGGMSLHDWYAGQALPAACTLAFANISQASSMDLLPEEWAAKIALSVADAMIAERDK